MHDVFNPITNIQQGILVPPFWPYIKDGLRRNLETVISYYRRNAFGVKSQHFLVRLLHSINVPFSHNLERYYAIVDSFSLHLSMSLKMTSSIYAGKIFDGVFYGPDCPEILIAIDDGFDIFDAHDNWKDLRPINVLMHSRSDLGLNILDGTNTGSETGIAMLTINIPMLAVMYRAFSLNEDYVTEGDPDSRLSVMQFIHMYVLPNMLHTHLDHAIFNRIDNLQKGAPLGESSKRHPFYITDFSSKLNGVHRTILDKIYKSNYDFSTVMRNVPLINVKDVRELLVIKGIAVTRQVEWALALARIHALKFLFIATKYGPGNRNQSELNYLIRKLIAYKSNNLFRTSLPIEIYYDVQKDLDYLLKTAQA